jgi:hypothetical protein
MASSPQSHGAYNYAERIRERLPHLNLNAVFS